jgi:aspartate kinase
MKFGGTSVEDARAIRRIGAIVKLELRRQPVVVVSACAGVTNQLIRIANLAAERNLKQAVREIGDLRRRHMRIGRDLLPRRNSARIVKQLNRYADELSTLARGVSALGELTPRSKDAFMSYGEKMSSLLVQHHFANSRIKSVLVDAQSFMLTDARYTKAVPEPAAVRRRLRHLVVPHLRHGSIVLTQGFLGATAESVPTTLGRGGSDFSASFIGALLGAKEIQIWTDVDGILTADPTLVKEAQNIPLLSFREASELAYFGARVLHPDTILPAVKKSIPVLVLNSRKPDSPGTRVVAKRPRERKKVVQSIAYKEGVTILNIVSTRMFLSHGFLENVFDVFDKYKTVVHTVATSDVSITAAIDDTSHLHSLVKELRSFATVTVSSGKAIVCAVGEGLRSAAGTAARVLGAVGDVDINMISSGASEINLSMVVAEEAIGTVVKRLHDTFFPTAYMLKGQK